MPEAGKGQASPTANRAGALQIGAGFSSANANYEYVHNRISGFFFYADFDFTGHIGLETSFHQLNDPNSAVYERSIEAGARYILHYTVGRVDVHPYVKAEAGVGILNFPKYANLGYNMLSGSGGVDFSVHPRVNVRAEFEYQDWLSAPGAGLTIKPTIFSLGVAYNFNGGDPSKRRRH